MTTCRMRALFILQPVGQGLFYTGLFSSPETGSSFNFVYDCGSDSNSIFLKSRIARFKKMVNNNMLHLLVILHLDSDHCSGLDALLLKGGKLGVKCAILPYLSKVERLMIAARTKVRSSWIYSFLDDPARYLLDRDVEKVVFFSPSERQGEEPTRTPEEQETDDMIPRIDEGSFEFDYNNEVRSNAIEEMPAWGKLFDDGKVMIRKTKGYLNLHTWFFKFFCVKPEKQALENFRKKVEDTFGKQWEIRDFASPDKRKLLRRLYDDLCEENKKLGNINNTSLISLHESLLRGNALLEVGSFYASRTGRCFCALRGEILWRISPSWFLTGDADFKRSDTYSEVSRHFGLQSNKVTSVLIPHHGSAYSWNRNLLSIGSGPFYVSAGVSNKHGHPSGKVVLDINRKSELLMWSNEIYGTFESWFF